MRLLPLISSLLFLVVHGSQVPEEAMARKEFVTIPESDSAELPTFLEFCATMGRISLKCSFSLRNLKP